MLRLAVGDVALCDPRGNVLSRVAVKNLPARLACFVELDHWRREERNVLKRLLRLIGILVMGHEPPVSSVGIVDRNANLHGRPGHHPLRAIESIAALAQEIREDDRMTLRPGGVSLRSALHDSALVNSVVEP